MRVTLQDIAQATGLSASTVSRALRGYHDIAEETRNKVLEASARLGYTFPPGRGAAWRGTEGLGRGRGRGRGRGTAPLEHHKLSQLLVFSSNSHQLVVTHDRVLSGVRDFVSEIGAGLSLLDLDHELPGHMLEMMKAQYLGALFIMPLIAHPLIAQCRSHGIPVAVANRSAAMMAPQPVDIAVCADERKVADLIVSHLIDKGHKAIAFVASYPENCMMKTRALMLKTALTEAGLPVRDDWFLFGTDAHKKNVPQIFRTAEPPTALVCASDIIALRCIKSLSEAGFSVPDDVSVIGVHDIPIATIINPALTTVHIPLRQIGYETAKQLFHWKPGDQNCRIDVVYQPHLVERDSVRPLTT